MYYYYIVLAEDLDQMVFKDPFHPKPFCDFVTHDIIGKPKPTH